MKARSIRFLPWKGKNYTTGIFGLKTLVLGESHYQWSGTSDINAQSKVTCDCIQEQLDGDYTKAFWTNIATAFLNRSPSLEEKRDFWHSVAFYNYIQESVGNGARTRPTESHWKQSETAFAEVLDLLAPDFIVVLGYQNWQKLPYLNGRHADDISNAAQKKTFIYPHRRGSALAYAIKHPSSGFSGTTWHPHIMAAANLAKTLQAGCSKGLN